MPTIADDATVVRRSRVVANDLNDDETVMLDVDAGTYFGVAGVARTIWDGLAEPTTPRSLVASLMSEYDVSETTCRAEVAAFLAQLAGAGLIDVEHDPGTSP